MSASPFFYIEVYNHKLGNWEKFDIYHLTEKGEFKPCNLWPYNGTHELFSILEIEHSSDMPEFGAVHDGLPIDASPEMYSIFNKHSWTEGDTIYTPAVKWFNLADAKLYLNDYPKVIDEEAMEHWWAEAGDVPYNEVPKQTMPNPLKSLVERVETFLDAGDGFWRWDHSTSDVRVICWCSW